VLSLPEQKNPRVRETWNAKFRKSVSKKISINGHVSDEDIANEFAVHVQKVFHSSDNEAAYNEYYIEKTAYSLSNVV